MNAFCFKATRFSIFLVFSAIMFSLGGNVVAQEGGSRVCFTVFNPGTFSIREVQRIDTTEDAQEDPCPPAASRVTGTIAPPGPLQTDPPLDTGFSDLILGRNGFTGNPAILSFDEDVGLGRRNNSQLTVSTDGGQWELTNDSDLFDLGGEGIAPKFVNNGIFKKADGTGVSNVLVEFQSIGGSIEVDAGTLRFAGPSTRISNTEVSGPGDLVFTTETGLAGSSVSGGVLRTEGTGVVQVGHNSQISDITNEGRLELAAQAFGNTGVASASGTIINNGEIGTNSGNVRQTLAIDTAGVTLTGDGTFNVESGQVLLSGGTLTNQSLITGNGTLSAAGIQNESTIEASAGGRFLVSGNITNEDTGVIQSRTGGTLILRGAIDNSASTVQSLDGSTVLLNAGDVSGGVLRTEGTGVVQVGHNSQISDITNEGRLELAAQAFGNTGVASASGTIINNGEIGTNSGNVRQTLAIDTAGVTLTGDGTFNVESGQVLLSGGTLTNQSLITGNGTLSAAGIQNESTIEASAGGRFLVSGNITNEDTGVIQSRTGGLITLSGLTQNSGAVLVQENSNIIVQQSTLDTSGTVIVDRLSELSFNSVPETNFNQSVGITTVNGRLISDKININGGTIGGSGVIEGNLNIGPGGAVAPGNSPGTLSVDGDLNLDMGTSVFLEIEGISFGEFDRILVSGSLALEGNVFFQLATGISNDIFEPNFRITDFFLEFNPFTNTENVISDIALFLNANYFVQSGGSTFDVSINQNDGSFLVSNDPVVPVQGVPEPSMLALFGFGITGLLYYRRRRQLI